MCAQRLARQWTAGRSQQNSDSSQQGAVGALLSSRKTSLHGSLLPLPVPACIADRWLLSTSTNACLGVSCCPLCRVHGWLMSTSPPAADGECMAWLRPPAVHLPACIAGPWLSVVCRWCALAWLAVSCCPPACLAAGCLPTCPAAWLARDYHPRLHDQHHLLPTFRSAWLLVASYCRPLRLRSQLLPAARLHGWHMLTLAACMI